MTLVCNFSILNNGEGDINIYLPAKQTRMCITMKFKSNQKEKFYSTITSQINNNYNDFLLLHESTIDLDNEMCELQLVYLMNFSYITKISSSLKDKYPNSNINQIIFTNDIENNIHCTNLINAFQPVNNGQVNDFYQYSEIFD